MKIIKQLFCKHKWHVTLPVWQGKRYQINYCNKCDKLTILK